MKLILFSKMLKDRTIDELADLAVDLGIDGYDLAVRPGYAVNPDNVGQALPAAAATLQQPSSKSLPETTRPFWPLPAP